MKFTVLTRSSRSTVSRKYLRNMDPLAPVVDTVRFSGGGRYKNCPLWRNAASCIERLRIGSGAGTSQGGGGHCLFFGFCFFVSKRLTQSTINNHPFLHGHPTPLTNPAQPRPAS